MSNSERGIALSSDFDGVHCRAPVPLKTVYNALVHKDFFPPRSSKSSLKKTTLLELIFHRIRPIKEKPGESIQFFKMIAAENDRSLQIWINSGRPEEMRAITLALLKRGGVEVDGVHLNNGNGSIDSKVEKAKNFLEQGLALVHIDDDVRPVIKIAELDKKYPGRVLVYLTENSSNHPYLVKRAGQELPANIVRVRNLLDAAKDFEKKLKEGRI